MDLLGKKAKKIKVAYDKTFSSEEGRAVLFDLIDSVGLLGPSVDYKNPTVIGMAYNDGAKSIVHRILEQLNVSPEAYVEILEQKQKDQENYFEI